MSASSRNQYCKTLNLENKQIICVLYKSGVLRKLDASNDPGIVEYLQEVDVSGNPWVKLSMCILDFLKGRK